MTTRLSNSRIAKSLELGVQDAQQRRVRRTATDSLDREGRRALLALEQVLVFATLAAALSGSIFVVGTI